MQSRKSSTLKLHFSNYYSTEGLMSLQETVPCFNLKSNIQGGPQKYPYFSLAITFTKIRKPSRFFLHRYWKFIKLFWWKQSIMFSYIFSVINIRFVPCTVLLYDSTAATRTLKLSTTLLSISCGIHLISLLIMSSLVCGFFSQTLSFK